MSAAGMVFRAEAGNFASVIANDSLASATPEAGQGAAELKVHAGDGMVDTPFDDSRAWTEPLFGDWSSAFAQSPRTVPAAGVADTTAASDAMSTAGAVFSTATPPGASDLQAGGSSAPLVGRASTDADLLAAALNAGLGSGSGSGGSSGGGGATGPGAAGPGGGGALTLPCGLADWRVTESGGSASGRGTVTTQGGQLVLREGDSFVLALQHTFTIPQVPTFLTFAYQASFDTTATGFIKDAFEAALVDAQNQPVVQPFTSDRDAFFNVTEGQPVATGMGTSLDGQTINLDISRLVPGSSATLLLRLVNNDRDSNTAVRIFCSEPDAPPAASVRLANDTAPEGPGTEAYRSDRLTNDATVTGTATDDQGVSRLEAQVDGGAFQDITATLSGTQYRYDPGRLVPGPHRLTVRATDTSGQSTEAVLDFRVNTPPVANAGGNQTANEGATVSFDGRASSDAEGPLFATRWTFHDNTTADGPTASKSYPQDGTYPVRLTVTDTAGSVVTDTISVTVRNVAPEVLTASDLTGLEGQALDFLGTFRDAGVLDTHTARVYWSDGTDTPGQVTESAGQGTVTARHAFADDGVYPLRVEVRDDAGDAGSRAARATISNAPPVVLTATNLTGTEGQSLSFTATFADPGIRDTHTAIIYWGDDSSTIGQVTEAGGQGTVTASHTYLDNGAYPIRVEVRDNANAVGSYSATATVANVAPTILTANNLAGNEGQRLDFVGTFTDPGVRDTHTAILYWGDGTSSAGQVAEANGQGTVTGSHVYADNGTYTIRLEVRDNDGAAASRQATAALANVAPAVQAGFGYQAVNAQLAVVVSGSFTDPGFTRAAAGTAETFTATINWGDGAAEPVTVVTTQGAEGVLTRGTFSASHQYARGGVYTAVVTVRDDDAGTGTVTLAYGVMRIDVRSTINLGSQGEIPVLIYSDPGFDPLRLVVSSLRFGPRGAAEDHGQLHGHGQGAMTHYLTQLAGIRPADTVAFLTGQLPDGTFFVGVDEIRIVPPHQGPPPPTSPPGATKFFVVDADADTAFRYGSSGTGTGSFALDTALPNARGAASNAAGDTVWIIDGTTHQVAVQGPDGSQRGAWLALGLTSPQGVATDNRDIWVVDAGLRKVLRYVGAARQTAGAAAPASAFALHPDNVSPSDLTTDGTLFWITDDARREVFVYDGGGNLAGRWQLDAANAAPSGITLNPAGGTDLWVVDRVTQRVYYYAGAMAWRSGSQSAASTFALAGTNRRPEGIADPPALALQTPADGSSVPAGSAVVVSGQALGGNQVRVNGVPVDAVDAAGNFFSRLTVSPGQNAFQLTATDASGQTASRTLTVSGVQAAPGVVNYDALADVSAGIAGEYGRTSFTGSADLLHTDLAVRNTGTFGFDAPLLVGIVHLSEPTVRLRNADGMTPSGIPYYDFSKLVAGGKLAPGQVTGTRGLAFYNPRRGPFTYDLVILGQLNQPPVFTTVPVVQALAGKPYSYDADATDPNNDPLTFSLRSGPSGLTVDAATGLLRWSPTTSDLGTHAVTVRVEDGRGGAAEQRFTVAVTAPPPNRPPFFTSIPLVAAQVNRPYSYDAEATDPDSDPLTFALVSRSLPVTITNPGFEAQVLGDGGFVFGLTGWTGTGGGAFNPGSGQYPGSRVSEGQNVAFSDGGTFSQILTERLTAGTTYTLQVEVGRRLDLGFAGARVQLFAGGVLLAEDASANPAPGTFVTATVRYSATSASPRLGQPLEIRLVSPGRQPNYDNVRLTAQIEPPAGLTIDAATGLVRWTPTADQLGSHELTLTAADGRGGTATQVYTINVTKEPGNSNPVIVSDPVRTHTLPQGTGAGAAVVLEATVRDFRISHPDFEDGISGLVTGLVQPTLGADRKPVFVGPNGRGAITSAATFNQWYNDVDGVNQRTALPLILNETTPGSGVYAFNSGSFFPIDGQLFGNEGLSHNYHFTLELHNAFTYRGGEVFQFTGDDDIWVFLNDRLVVDLGGVHGPASGSVSLDTLGLTRGNAYRFDFFFAERHTTGSNFLLQTGLELISARQYSYQVAAVDADGDALSYSLTTAPDGMRIDPATGLVTWNPRGNQVGSHNVTVRIVDARGGATTQSYVLQVVAPGTAQIRGTVFNDLNGNGVRDTQPNPAVFGPNLIVNGNAEGGVSSANGLTIVRPVPGWTPTGSFTVVAYGADGSFPTPASPGPADRGNAFFAGGPDNPSSNATQTIDVSAGAETIDAGGVTFNLAGWLGGFASQTDNAVLTASFKQTNGATLGTASIGPVTAAERGAVTGLFLRSQAGSVPVGTRRIDLVLQMTRGEGAYNDGYADNLSLVLSAVPRLSEPGLPNWTIYLDDNRNGRRDAGELFTTSDVNGSYAFTGLPASSYIVAEEPQAGWAQTAPASRSYSITLAAGQVVSNAHFGNQRLTAANRPPTFVSTAPTEAVVGQFLRYNALAADPDQDRLSYSLSVKPAGMAIDPATGTVGWMPTAEQVGTHDVLLKVEDGRGGMALQPFRVTVTLPNTAPVITSRPPGPAVVGRSYPYAFRAQDAENDPLTFRVDMGPVGLAINAGTGLVSWTPTAGQVGAQRVVLTVSDARGATATQTFDLPVVVNAPPNAPPAITSTPRTTIQLGGAYIYAVQAADPNNDPLTFRLVTAPAGLTLDPTGLITWSPTVVQFGLNPVSVRVEDGQGGFAVQDFTITVVAQATNQPPSIVSPPPATATVGQPYRYDAAATEPDGDPLAWSLAVAPAGMSIDPRLGTVRWTPTAEQIGTLDVVLRAVDAQGGSATQSFRITVQGVNVPPSLTSAPPTQASVGQPYTYAVQATDPDGDPLTFSLVAPPTGLTINPTTGLIQWTPQASQVGPQLVALRVEDGRGGVVTQNYTVVVAATTPNQPPVVTSTPPFVATVGELYQYLATAADPDGDALRFMLATAPAGMTIDPTSGLVQWTPAAGQLGANPITVTVSDPAGNFATQSFTITVRNVNRPPAITSSPPLTITAGLTYRYAVRATDPDGDPLTYRLTSGPAGMTVDGFGRLSWPTSAANVGTARVVLSVADNRGGATEQAFDLTVMADSQAPRVELTLSTTSAALGSLVTFAVLGTDNVGVAAVNLTVGGVPVSLDTSGRATVRVDRAGQFEVVANVRDAAGNTARTTATLVVLDPHVVGAPTVALTTPGEDAVVTGQTDIIGTASDANLLFYKLEVAPLAGGPFREFARSTTSVVNGVLGRFDPSLLSNDSYVVRLTAQNTGGNASLIERVLSVAGDLKLGNFTLSFTDLAVAVAGIPLSVSRTYDTLNASSRGDFGFGWRLEFRNTDLRTNVAPTGLEAYGLYNPFRDGTRVYVTLPGGRREGFTFRPRLNPRLNIPGLTQDLYYYDAAFEADRGGTSRLSVRDVQPLQRDATTGEYFRLGLGRTPFHPADPFFSASYVLTTKEGVAYQIEPASGKLLTVSEPNGNTLTFTDAGVSSTSGVQVVFGRDPQGRIASVTDPMGQAVRYQYDAQGDLVAVTDQQNSTTRFVYNSTPAHYLQQVIDPLGRTGVRNEYDAQGRLVRTIDAKGQAVQLIHDPANAVETVRDQLGKPTTYVYDARGNIVTVVNALGATIQRTYDADSNILTETDPYFAGDPIRTRRFTYDAAGNVLSATDALGNVARATYNSRNLVLTSTSPLGNTTTNEYDPLGNLLATTDALGNTTRYAYAPGGNLTLSTDAAGNVTRFPEYNRFGKPLRQIDALGHEVRFTYDANGNQLTLTTTMTTPQGPRTLMTSTRYDASNRVTAVTAAEGSTTQTLYNAVGKPEFTVDSFNRRTQYVYDERGLLTETRYPDGFSDRATYDAAGRRITSTDRAGRVTLYRYDEIGQLLETIYPDETPGDLTDNPRTRTDYDAAGRVRAQTDERGNRTEIRYDELGRQVAVRDALGGEILSAYDVAGRRISETDALSRTTRFVYDALDRLVQTLFVDGTTTSTTYDVLGHKRAFTDQEGRTTRSEYDALGRLTAVVDARLKRTEYGYDEVGNLTSQRDANGRITRYEYDSRGRRTATVLPLGQRSSTQYDRSESTTDFNGTTIRYEYDANNGRLLAKRYPDGTSVAFTYTPTGQRETVTDSLGITRYLYDSRDRLRSRTDPDGSRIEYGYDPAGNRTALTVTVGTTARTTSYAFDALNRLRTVTDPQTGMTRYTYDPASNLRRTELPNGTVETRDYDDLNRLQFLENTGPQGIISNFTYTRGPSGNIGAVQENGGRRVDYAYDALYRLTSETITDPAAGNRTIGYTYDDVGNRLTRTDSAEGLTTYRYDDNDRLLSETLAGQTTVYTYDENGNTLSRFTNATNQYSYRWDFENHLVHVDAVTPTGTMQVEHRYSSQGIRTASVLNGQETRYLVDANRPYAQVLLEYTPGGTVQAAFVYGIQAISQTVAGADAFPHFDGLGSVRSLSNATGTITDRYVYDAFGRLLSRTGTTRNQHLFTGEQLDGPTGLYYLRARYYDPASGRFASSDLIEGNRRDPVSLHKYLYTGANPVNRTDPSGLSYNLYDIASSFIISAAINTIPAYTLGRLAIGAVQLGVTVAYVNRNLPPLSAQLNVLSNTVARSPFAKPGLALAISTIAAEVSAEAQRLIEGAALRPGLALAPTLNTAYSLYNAVTAYRAITSALERTAQTVLKYEQEIVSLTSQQSPQLSSRLQRILDFLRTHDDLTVSIDKLRLVTLVLGFSIDLAELVALANNVLVGLKDGNTSLLEDQAKLLAEKLHEYRLVSITISL